MGTISEGVTSLLEGRDPAPPPSSISTFLVYTVLFGVVVLQTARHRPLDRGSTSRASPSRSLGAAHAYRALAGVEPRLGCPRPRPRAEAVSACRFSSSLRACRISPTSFCLAVRSLCVGGSSERSGRTRRSAVRVAAVMRLLGQTRPESLRASHEHDHRATHRASRRARSARERRQSRDRLDPERGRNRRPPHRRRQLPPARARYLRGRPPRERADSRRGTGGHRGGVPRPPRRPAGDRGDDPRRARHHRGRAIGLLPPRRQRFRRPFHRLARDRRGGRAPPHRSGHALESTAHRLEAADAATCVARSSSWRRPSSHGRSSGSSSSRSASPISTCTPDEPQ